MNKQSRSHAPGLYVVCVFAGLGLILLYYLYTLSRAIYIPYWDQAHHLSVAYDWGRSVAAHDIRTMWQLFRSGDQYPPLWHIVVGVLMAVFGPHPKLGPVVNIFSGIGLGAGFLLLAKVFIRDRWLALLMACLLLLLPGIHSLMLDALIDLPAVTLTVFLWWSVFASNGLTGKKYVVLSGIILCAIVLIKWSVIVFSAPLIVYVAVVLYNARNRPAAIMALVVMALCLVPALPWYMTHMRFIMDARQYFGNLVNYPMVMWGHPHGLQASNLLYYVNVLLGDQGVGLLVLAVYMVTFGSRSVMRDRKMWYVIAGTVVVYAVFTLLHEKAAKYMAVVYPFIMLQIGVLLDRSRKNTRVIIAVALATTLVCNVAAGDILKRLTEIRAPYLSFSVFPSIDSKLSGSGWPTYRIFRHPSFRSAQPQSLLITSDTAQMNKPTLEFVAKTQHIRVTVTAPYEIYDPSRPKRAVVGKAAGFDYILAKSGDPGIFADKNVSDLITRYATSSGLFVTVDTFSLPDGSVAVLFKKNAGSGSGQGRVP